MRACLSLLYAVLSAVVMQSSTAASIVTVYVCTLHYASQVQGQFPWLSSYSCCPSACQSQRETQRAKLKLPVLTAADVAVEHACRSGGDQPERHIAL